MNHEAIFGQCSGTLAGPTRAYRVLFNATLASSDLSAHNGVRIVLTPTLKFSRNWDRLPTVITDVIASLINCRDVPPIDIRMEVIDPIDFSGKSIVTGDSFLLPMVVAAWSAIVRLPLDPKIVFTGSLDARGRILPVDQVKVKLRDVPAGFRFVFPLLNIDEGNSSSTTTHACADIRQALDYVGLEWPSRKSTAPRAATSLLDAVAFVLPPSYVVERWSESALIISGGSVGLCWISEENSSHLLDPSTFVSLKNHLVAAARNGLKEWVNSSLRPTTAVRTLPAAWSDSFHCGMLRLNAAMLEEFFQRDQALERAYLPYPFALELLHILRETTPDSGGAGKHR